MTGAKLKYRPEIDGLRTIAVLGVVLFHFSPKLLPGGFTGVDVFFVISGYLITSILIKDFDEGSFSFKEFWSRRIRRILPAYGFLIICTVAAGYLLLFPTRFASLGGQALGATTFVANHTILGMAGNYWDQAAESLPLLHLWSLALEEQFYILIPLFLWAVRRHDWSTKAIILLVGAFISLGLSIVLTPVRPGIAYFLLPARFWELAAGCLIALGLRIGWFRAPKAWLANLGLATVLISMVALKGDYGFPGAFALLPVGGAALFILNSPAGGIARNILARGWMPAVGKMSFSLYLWHWPALVLSAAWVSLYQVGSESGRLWAAFAVMVAGTAISYLWVEKLGRNLKAPLIFAACGMPVLALVAGLASQAPHAPEIREGYRADWLGDRYDCFPAPISEGDLRWHGIARPHLSAEPSASPRLAKDVVGGAASGRMVMVLGDSHALTWASLIDRIAAENHLRARYFCTSGRAPGIRFRGQLNAHEADEFVRRQLQVIALEKPQFILVAFRMDHLREGQVRDVVDFLDQARAVSGTSKILILQQAPLLAMDNVSAPWWLEWRSRRMAADTMVVRMSHGGNLEANEGILREYVSRNLAHAAFLPLPPLLAEGDARVRVVAGAGALYVDDDHLSERGASVFADVFRQALAENLK